MSDQGPAAARSAMAHNLVLPDCVFPAMPGALAVPATVADAGAAAARRYVELFAAQIRNPNTRADYAQASSDSSRGVRCGSASISSNTVAPKACTSFLA